VLEDAVTLEALQQQEQPELSLISIDSLPPGLMPVPKGSSHSLPGGISAQTH
jgi:hypothetical protein